MTSAIATQMFEASPYATPATPIRKKPIASHWPSRHRSAMFAITRLPTTKPTEVSPSWRPYSNVVACSGPRANGSSRVFQRPNDR